MHMQRGLSVFVRLSQRRVFSTAPQTILGIETSCDETAIAVVQSAKGMIRVLSAETVDQWQLLREYHGDGNECRVTFFQDVCIQV